MSLLLIEKVASRFYPNGNYERGDLISWGFIGLRRAEATFDPNKGSAFRSFAWRCIRSAIIDGIRSWQEYIPAEFSCPQNYPDHYPLLIDVNRALQSLPEGWVNGGKPSKNQRAKLIKILRKRLSCYNKRILPKEVDRCSIPVYNV